MLLFFQDHLIPNPVWKEYSANTNYAFEAFDTKDKKKQINGNKKNHNHQEPEARSDHAPVKMISRVQRPQTRPPSVPNQQPGSYPGDTRSLQRPKGAYSSTNMERSTLSLPRTAYDRNQRNGEPELQPDFYFMPSQRKYSGEVVRVYVDYNNQNKK